MWTKRALPVFCRPDVAFAPQVEELRRDLRIKSQAGGEGRGG